MKHQRKIESPMTQPSTPTFKVSESNLPVCRRTGGNDLSRDSIRPIVSTIFLVILLLVTPIQTGANDNCGEAQKLYDRATGLLNYQERKDLFLKAVELCPSFSEAHTNLADSYENLGDFENAERHYREALTLHPIFSAPYVGLGEVYLKTGRYGMANETFLRGLEISPSDERLQAGRTVAAERLIREKRFYDFVQIKDCLVADEDFRLMCMCPGDHYSFLRRWICVPPIIFNPGSWSLSPQMQRQLVEIGNAMKAEELAGKKWLIIGHSDIVGNETTNLRLSKQRASVVSGYLERNVGVEPKILQIKFFGQNRPRSSNSTLEGRSENRRVEIVLDE